MNERWVNGPISRRHFLGRFASISTLGGLVLVAMACGDDTGNPNPEDRCAGAVQGDVAPSSGHTHIVDEVCLSDSGSETLLLLTGFGHTHTVTLSGEQVDGILTGQPLSVTSSSVDDHAHQVGFNGA